MHYRGTAHTILFSLLLLTGCLGWIEIYYNSITTTLISILVSLGLFVSVIASCVRQRDSGVKVGLRRVTWTALGYVCVLYLIGYIHYLAIFFKNPNVLHNQWGLIKLYSEISLLESPLLLTTQIIATAGAFSLAIPGLILLRKSSRAIKE